MVKIDTLKIDSPKIDSHCHLWSVARGDYFWMDVTNPAQAPIARDFAIADLENVQRDFDISTSIVVQAAQTVAETEYLLSLAHTTPKLAGVVGWVDMSDATSCGILEDLAQQPKFKGIRPMLQDIEDTDWILTAPRRDVLDSVVSCGLRFDALVLPRHLPNLLKFCHANPDMPIVIDHCAKPDLSQGTSGAAYERWATDMEALARETNVLCKVSGLLTEMRPDQQSGAQAILQPLVADVIQWFGPNRLMWGSDWPVLRMASDYDVWAPLAEHLLSDLDAEAQTAIWGGTAAKFYGIEG